MSRVLPFLIAMALVALSCSGSTNDQATTDQATAAASTNTDPPAVDVVNESGDRLSAASDGADDEQLNLEPAASPTRLLPDPERWVVIEDWTLRSGGASAANDFDGVQLDVVPLDEDGVPQLGRRISLNYRLGIVEDFDRQWGDASSMGEPLDFVVGETIGRTVHNEQMGFSMAQLWDNGTFVSIQTMDPDTDLTELAHSLAVVDEETWTAAREGVDAQRLIAVEAAMLNVEPPPPPGEPMPHWVLPEPWQLEWVTDKTIWTPEQQAQAVAFSEANRPAAALTPTSYEIWHFGLADTAEEAAMQFVPQLSISTVVFTDGPDHMHPANYDTISALGLDGVISPIMGGSPSALVELGTGDLRVFVQTTNLDEGGAREFLDVIEFASDDPLDGFVVSDPRFQPIKLEELDQPANWHAAWNNAGGGPDALASVWRLSVPELRAWLQGRGTGLSVPDDVWEIIAANDMIDFGQGTTYDVSTGLLMALRGIEQDDLIPIELQDWITLVAPVNTDPIRPR